MGTRGNEGRALARKSFLNRCQFLSLVSWMEGTRKVRDSLSCSADTHNKQASEASRSPCLSGAHPSHPQPRPKASFLVSFFMFLSMCGRELHDLHTPDDLAPHPQLLLPWVCAWWHTLMSKFERWNRQVKLSPLLLFLGASLPAGSMCLTLLSTGKGKGLPLSRGPALPALGQAGKPISFWFSAWASPHALMSLWSVITVTFCSPAALLLVLIFSWSRTQARQRSAIYRHLPPHNRTA